MSKYEVTSRVVGTYDNEDTFKTSMDMGSREMFEYLNSNRTVVESLPASGVKVGKPYSVRIGDDFVEVRFNLSQQQQFVDALKAAGLAFRPDLKACVDYVAEGSTAHQIFKVLVTKDPALSMEERVKHVLLHGFKTIISVDDISRHNFCVVGLMEVLGGDNE